VGCDEGSEEEVAMLEYPTMYNATVRVINGENHLGFVQDGEFVDLGRAVLAMTEQDEETGAYKMVWMLVREKKDAPKSV
jgi:hypothetical protein